MQASEVFLLHLSVQVPHYFSLYSTPSKISAICNAITMGGIRLPRALFALHLVTPSHVKLMSASIPIIARIRNRMIDGSGMCRSSD